MIPAFSIASNGKDYSNTYRQRMVSLKVSEDAGEHSDTFEVELADTDGKVPIPVKGEMVLLKERGVNGESGAEMKALKESEERAIEMLKLKAGSARRAELEAVRWCSMC